MPRRFALGFLLTILLASAGCQRSLSARHAPPGQALAHYPWQMPEWRHPAAPPGQPPTAGSSGEVSIPNGMGRHPALGKIDTLDPALLPGDWLLVAYVQAEQMGLRPPDGFSVFRFAANGSMHFLRVIGGEVKQTETGTWEKSAPGVLLISLNGVAPLTYYVEFASADFLYLWTFDNNKQGFWLARGPAQSSTFIERNDFNFTSGEHLRLTAVRGNTYEGYIEGPRRLQVTGAYAHGVLNMHWVDSASNADGFAAFVVSPDWKGLDGVWWLNDYEAAPFGGRWQTAESAHGVPSSSTSSGGTA